MDAAWIAAPFGVILTPHACPARCEGTAPNRTARLRSAPCLVLQKVRFLRRHAPPCQSAAARAAPINSPKRQVRLSASRRAVKLPDRHLCADSHRHRHLLERQREGVAKAKADGKYKGRKPTARAKAAEVLRLSGEGMQRTEIARRLEIGVASVYRMLADAKTPIGDLKAAV